MSWGKATEYFLRKVIVKRPYIKPEWIEKARKGKCVVKENIQSDGKIRKWIYISQEDKYLRVIFLSDGETVHNAFFDRNFKKGG